MLGAREGRLQDLIGCRGEPFESCADLGAQVLLLDRPSLETDVVVGPGLDHRPIWPRSADCGGLSAGDAVGRRRGGGHARRCLRGAGVQGAAGGLAGAAAGDAGAYAPACPILEHAYGIGAHLDVLPGPGAPVRWLATYGATRCLVQPRGACVEASQDVDHESVRMRAEPAKVADIVAVECPDRHCDLQYIGTEASEVSWRRVRGLARAVGDSAGVMSRTAAAWARGYGGLGRVARGRS